jgi:pullulanase
MRDQYAIPADPGHPAAQCRLRRHRPAAYVFMTLLALLSTALSPTAAHADNGLRADCDAPEQTRVLHPAAEPAREAHAYWLDRRTIQWPGAPVDGHFRLYHSVTAGLRTMSARPIRDVGGYVELTLAKGEMTAAQAERFRFIGAGPRLTVPAPVVARLRDRLDEQMVLVRLDRQGTIRAVTELQIPGVLDDLYAAAEDATLGVHRYPPRPDAEDFATRFALWAPTAQAVAVCLYSDGQASDGRASEALPARRDDTNGVWTLDLPGTAHGREYAYLVDVFVSGVGIVRNRVTDPYAVGLTTDSARSVVLDLDAADTKPAGWDAAVRPAPIAANVDLGVYELHVRDFSRDDASVRAPWRGKYLAFTEPASAGMRHLRALGEAGITDVHLLPAYDLSTVPERDCVVPKIPAAAPDGEAQQAAVAAVAAKDCFNWGYDPWHYSVPEGSYALEPDGATRAREFRAMVQSLHAAGLRVGMDVVYNHTFASGQGPKSVLDRIVPGYYHRLDASGKVERSTCCENTATEHRMMAKLMIDSAALWAKHYRIDSFRFDLMGHQPREAMERLQIAVDAAAGRHVPLLGEGWNFGEIANSARFVQASQRSLGGSGIATFSDRARDALRGGGCCDGGEGLVANQGLLNGLHYAPNALNAGKNRRAELLRAADLVRIGLAGTLRDVELEGADGVLRPLSKFEYADQPAGYASQPGEVVNYVENHDNLTLFDLNALRLPRDTSREDRARVQMLGVAFTAFSQGVAYYHAGIELLRSKSLDKNSFDSGDAFNRLDWSYADNGFGTGLPPAKDNAKDWAWMRPVLADVGIKPRPADIAWMRDAFNDLLRIRRSSTLFRMRSSEDVQKRLTFRNTGPEQNPMVIAAHLDGAGYAGAGFREILYLINVAPDAQTLVLPEEAGKAYVLHPVQRAAQAADDRPKAARYVPRSGRFTVPPRAAMVYVVE